MQIKKRCLLWLLASYMLVTMKVSVNQGKYSLEDQWMLTQAKVIMQNHARMNTQWVFIHIESRENYKLERYQAGKAKQATVAAKNVDKGPIVPGLCSTP